MRVLGVRPLAVCSRTSLSDRRADRPAVDLGHGSEGHVAHRQTGTPTALRRLGDGGAQVGQHRQEAVLLLALSPVVSGPVLGVGDLDRLWSPTSPSGVNSRLIVYSTAMTCLQAWPRVS